MVYPNSKHTHIASTGDSPWPNCECGHVTAWRCGGAGAAERCAARLGWIGASGAMWSPVTWRLNQQNGRKLGLDQQQIRLYPRKLELNLEKMGLHQHKLGLNQQNGIFTSNLNVKKGDLNTNKTSSVCVIIPL